MAIIIENGKGRSDKSKPYKNGDCSPDTRQSIHRPQNLCTVIISTTQSSEVHIALSQKSIMYWITIENLTHFIK